MFICMYTLEQKKLQYFINPITLSYLFYAELLARVYSNNFGTEHQNH